MSIHITNPCIKRLNCFTIIWTGTKTWCFSQMNRMTCFLQLAFCNMQQITWWDDGRSFAAEERVVCDLPYVITLVWSEGMIDVGMDVLATPLMTALLPPEIGPVTKIYVTFLLAGVLISAISVVISFCCLSTTCLTNTDGETACKTDFTFIKVTTCEYTSQTTSNYHRNHSLWVGVDFEVGVKRCTPRCNSEYCIILLNFFLAVGIKK